MAKGKGGKKNEFLKVFEKALGNVSVACKNFGIDRGTFYIWYNEDVDFRGKADAVKEIRKDFLESAFDKRVKAGDTTAIIFGLKTQCKDRGYVEKTEQEVKIDSDQPIFNIIQKKDD